MARAASQAVPAPLGLRLVRVRCARYSVNVSYQPMTLAALARLVAAQPDFDTQWRLVVEFLKEYHHEPASGRWGLLQDLSLIHI